MSTATTTTAENAGLPAMLDTKDVAEMFKRCNLAVYAEARRIYYREVNLNPCKKYPKQVLQRIEWWFWDWFAYDCAVSGIGLTGNESEDLRIELQYGPGAGISPFLALAEFMYDKDERIGTREIRDFRELDDTNFASMFWIRDASAVKGRLTVEDIIHGGVYEVADVHAASQYDGAHGGMIVNRIAHVRGVWRSCSSRSMRHEGLMTRKSVIRWPVHSGKPDINRTLPVWCGFSTGGPKTPVSTGKMWKPRAKPVLWTR